jgi:2-polyprenyl-3-methyl-5-hydroxy-6-metoxy-1,4-benzoquinol methylase
MNLSQRSKQSELLDIPEMPFDDIKRNMQELDFINTWLGGHHITITGIRNLISKGRITRDNTPWKICEIGCGGGDNLYAVSKWSNKNKIPVSLSGIDINPNCIEFAKSKANFPVTYIHSDYRDVVFDEKPDVIFSSLFCHHFSNEELISMMKWMQENSTAGFVINDLHRNLLAYYSIKWLTSAFSKSYMVKNDAPISVLRGFSSKELKTLMEKAGVSDFIINWKWAFRWLIIHKKKLHEYTGQTKLTALS